MQPQADQCFSLNLNSFPVIHEQFIIFDESMKMEFSSVFYSKFLKMAYEVVKNFLQNTFITHSF